MQCSQRVNQLLDQMTLAEKVGQVFVFTWRNLQQAKNDLRYHPSGYIRIYSDALTVTRQTREIQQLARIPLIIAADLERGIGGTIGGAIEVVTCMALGATDDENAAYDAARIIGEEAAAIGINMNYAPVLDINNNPSNPVINTRSFGGDASLVSRFGIAFARGLQDAGVANCGKHFPGHGDTHVDSHSLLGSVNRSRETLENNEIQPYRALIAAGVDAIMSAHLMVPAIEPERLPATLSHRIMTDLLRTELGFEGLAVSDAFDMKAVAANFPPEVSIPMAINAGCDQLVMPENNAMATAILTDAVNSGQVSEERLNEAVARVLTLKEKRGILDAPLPKVSNLPARLFTEGHTARIREIAAKTITLVKHDFHLPLKPGQKICCINISNKTMGREPFLEPESFGEYLAANELQVTSFTLTEAAAPAPELNEHVLAFVREADVIVLAAFINVRLSSGTVELPENILHELRTILQSDKPVILVSFGSPYLINQLPDAHTYLCAYGATQPSQQAMADVMTGKIPCTGKLPISLRHAQYQLSLQGPLT